MKKDVGLHFMIDCPFCVQSRAVLKLNCSALMILCPTCNAHAHFNSTASLTTIRIQCPVEVAALEAELAKQKAATEAWRRAKKARAADRKAKYNEVGTP